MCQEGYYGHKGFAGCFHFKPRDVAKMKKMARHFMGGFIRSHFPYNVEDLEDSYLITVPLAGRTKEDVTVSLINENINVKAEKPKIPERESLKDEPKEKKTGNDWYIPFFWKGYTFVDVNMDIPLPADANTDTLTSKMANGLLKISVGKKPAKNIDISDN